MTLPAALQTAFEEAVAQHRQGRGDLAASVYAQVLTANPNHAEALHLTGILALQGGNPTAAEPYIERALAAAPDVPKYHNTYANLLFALNRPADAMEALKQALALDPDMLDARFNLATVMQNLGLYVEAKAEFEAVLARDPNHAKAHNNLGATLKALNDRDGAFAHYQDAERLDPDLAEAVQNVAITYKLEGRPADALPKFERLMTLKPTDATRINLRTCLPGLAGSLDEINALRTDLMTAFDELSAQDLHMDDPNEELGALSHFFLAYHGLDDRPLNQAQADFFRRVAPSLSYVAPHCRSDKAWNPRRKIRVGIASVFFRNHTIGQLMKDLFTMFPREKLEIIAIGPRSTAAETEQIRADADAYVILPTHLGKARQTVSDLELDVLFYGDIGMEPVTYFLAFSRLAPVQCATWGHPVTSGIDTIDYFLSSEHLDLPEADADYVEKLIRLRFPPTAIARPDPIAALDRGHFGLPEDKHLYICPQSMFKLHPDIDDVFARILRADPQGEVVLLKGHPYWMEVLHKRLDAAMPDVKDRVRFLDRMSPNEFHNLLRLGDVMLDPLHFSGGLTSMQGFHYETPIVTLPARYMRGRVTYAYWRKMGLDDGIAETTDDYVDTAVRWGTDESERRAVSQKIAAHSDALYGDRRVADDLAAFFIERVESARPHPA